MANARSIQAAAVLALSSAVAGAPVHAQVDLDAYLRADTYETIKISPSGAYYAATVSLPDRTALVILRRSDRKPTARAMGPKDSAIANFWWVNDERVVIAMAERLGRREAPVPTGELHAVSADGTAGRMLVGHHDRDLEGAQVLTFVQNFKYAELIDTLPRDDDKMLVAMSGYGSSSSTYVVRMDVGTGKTTEVATAPLRRASFLSDAAGQVRFAVGHDRDNYSQLLYRDNDQSPWRTINEEKTSQRIEWPLGFSADGKTAYLQAQQAAGPDAVVAYVAAEGTRTTLLRDAVVDPESVARWGPDEAPVGVTLVTDQRRTRFFDEQSEAATVQRTLEKAFPGQGVRITSATRDGQLVVVLVSSDTNPGDFYLFDRKGGAVDGIFSRRTWLDPARAAPTRAITVTARDGLALHGYLTLPVGKGETGLPLVVLPHGGPFGVADTPDFDEEVQILAQAGYAVLRVNYRGSGGYGRAFLQAGARQWGKRMQDDISDATQWVVQQKIADPARMCVYGASYGAYAAMMALAREPDAFRCGVGYVGIYDLPMMYKEDAAKDRSLQIWLDDWLGTADTLAEVSPARRAAAITKPVFLAAGGEDRRAPIVQTRAMEKALTASGVTPEMLVFPTEGHGFYTLAHRQEYYVKLLDFLARHIGGQRAR